MQKKYKNKGVILLAVSYEDESKVKKYVKQEKVPYIVGGDAGSTRSEYGINGFPTAFLIDPDGKIAWKGHPAVVDNEIEKLLKESPPKSKGFLALKSASSAYNNASKLYKKKKYEEAMEAFKNIQKSFPNTKESSKAKKKIKKMKRNSKIMNMIKQAKAERKSEGWLSAARVLAEYGDQKDAVKYYKRIITKHPNVPQARLAREDLEALGVEIDDDDEEDDEDEEHEEDEED
ncbi:MAG: TlpA family protein disulfide reductase [Phycisphaerales bacterium]|nr:TlpA family protein disulfide reductase [Phycisphaerales bacterium]